ncbi:DUF2934 domain-containing protein [Neorhizobium sp. LMR1-1-1.1]
MGNERDEWIAARAYELWEQAGRPEGQDHEHWSQASRDWGTTSAGPAIEVVMGRRGILKNMRMSHP